MQNGDVKEKKPKPAPSSDNNEESKTNSRQVEVLDKSDADKLRKFLKDGSEFRGYLPTAKLILAKSQEGLKAKKLAKQLMQTFRLSEDFDSDSDASDSENAVYRQGRKAVVKLLTRSGEVSVDEESKVVTLAK